MPALISDLCSPFVSAHPVPAISASRAIAATHTSRARPTSAPLEALWVQAKTDSNAHDELLRQLEGVLRGLVRKALDARGYYLGSSDIDDVVQDLLIEVWAKDLARFDPAKGSMLSFLKTRVRWRTADAVRHVARACTDSLDAYLDEDDFDIVCSLPLPDETCIETERKHRLRLVKNVANRALATMDDDAARTSVQMHDIDGAPLREVARALNVHPSNATRARQRGLRVIARAMPAALRHAA